MVELTDDNSHTGCERVSHPDSPEIDEDAEDVLAVDRVGQPLAQLPVEAPDVPGVVGQGGDGGGEQARGW